MWSLILSSPSNISAQLHNKGDYLCNGCVWLSSSDVTELGTGLEGWAKSLKSRKHLQTSPPVTLPTTFSGVLPHGRCGSSLEHFLKNKLLYYNFAAPQNLAFDFYFCKIESHLIGMAEDVSHGPAAPPITFLPLTLKPALQPHQVMAFLGDMAFLAWLGTYCPQTFGSGNRDSDSIHSFAINHPGSLSVLFHKMRRLET